MVKIFELLARKVPSKLILFFLNNPSRSVTQSQLVKITKLSKPSVSVWLKKLVKSRLIERDVQAGRMTYKLVDSPVTRQLKILKVVSTLYPLLKDFDVDVYLFGSHARGEDDENSDVDLLIMCRQTKEMVKKLAFIEKKIGKKVHPVFHTYIEWSKVARENPAFYEMVEKSKIKLV